MANRQNRKGRSKSERFVALPFFMLQSPAWTRASATARALLIELLLVYRGTNNGYLALSVRDAADRLDCSKSTAARAFQELEDLGFIELSVTGSFNRRDRRAAEWRVTLYRCDRTGALPTKTFMRQVPHRQAHLERNFTVPPMGQTVPPVGQRA